LNRKLGGPQSKHANRLL